MHNIGTGKPSPKPKVQVTTKDPSRKNVLVPLDPTDKKTIMNATNTHINQINGLFKSYKLGTSVDCIRETSNSLMVITNNVASPSDLSLLEKYIKGIDDIETKDISSRLPQSKSFLKILGVPYFDEEKTPVKTTTVENILTNTHLFDNVTLSSRPRIIRASRNSDMAVIWVNIWDSQNGTKAKTLINRSFNFGRHIATVRGTSMNPGVPQCHNC